MTKSLYLSINKNIHIMKAIDFIERLPIEEEEDETQEDTGDLVPTDPIKKPK